MTKTIQIQNHSQVIFHDTSQTTQPLFDSYELAQVLGYTQASSLRKQTLTDWKEHLIVDKDFVMVRDEKTLLRYDAEYEAAGNGELKPTKTTRGRLFYTPAGVLKVFARTSKPTREIHQEFSNSGYLFNGTLPKADQKGDEVIKPEKPQAPGITKGERRFYYEVMRTLLADLERLTDPSLRELAIKSAEMILGPFALKDVRLGMGIKAFVKIVHPSAVPKRLSVAGPLFLQEDYYSMTRIGEMAAQAPERKMYTAVTAGHAADVVAKKLGYGHDQIRSEPLRFNQVKKRPDSTTGARREMVRFSKDFSNQVIRELRANPKFEATLPPPPVPKVPDGVISLV